MTISSDTKTVSLDSSVVTNWISKVYPGNAADNHVWAEATCTSPKTCSICGDTEGSALGHKWQAATCETPKTCSLCQVTEGEALGHSWKDATCTAPKTCSVCGNQAESKFCPQCGAPMGE